MCMHSLQSVGTGSWVVCYRFRAALSSTLSEFKVDPDSMGRETQKRAGCDVVMSGEIVPSF